MPKSRYASWNCNEKQIITKHEAEFKTDFARYLPLLEGRSFQQVKSFYYHECGRKQKKSQKKAARFVQQLECILEGRK